ncbi:MAG: LmbE family protein [Sphingobacteriaceae bacterium]|nr:LmbE family protein [Sphingobacteriaceae bacterium]
MILGAATRVKTRFGASLLFILLAVGVTWAQPGYGPPAGQPVGELYEQLGKLQVLGRVLYVAAHPDDENTRLLAWLAREKKVETAYLSLTRGDGGQNLIGKEVREGLGLIRTQELLAARRTDGARQFFTRANDFGYSKNPEETYTHWDHDSLLADVVWVIRMFKPDVIITRFNPEPSPTHGHHTASAQLAVEAFAAAADPNRFPEQLAFVQPWQAHSLYWNTSWWFYGREDFDKSGLLPIDVGSYNTSLGSGYGEIASASRSMHKSQGFGSARQRGQEIEYLKPLAGKTSTSDLFAGINLSWSRVAGGAALIKPLQKIQRDFDLRHPVLSVEALVAWRIQLTALSESYFKAQKLAECNALLVQLLGLWQELTANKFSVVPGDSLALTLRQIVRHRGEVQHLETRWEQLSWEAAGNLPYSYVLLETTAGLGQLPFNQQRDQKRVLKSADNLPLGNPFWLNGALDAGFFALNDLRWVGHTENPAPYQVRVRYAFRVWKRVHEVEVVLPVYYRWTDPAEGERFRPLEVVPALQPAFANANYLSRGGQVAVEVVVRADQDRPQAEVRLQLPDGWYAEPEVQTLQALKAGLEYRVTFQVLPGKQAASGSMGVAVVSAGKQYDRSLVRINYPHIPMQIQLKQAEAHLLLLDQPVGQGRIAFVPGAGDEIPDALRTLGYAVEVLSVAELTPEKLKNYRTVVAGVRLANTEAALGAKMPYLLGFVEAGGTLIWQYNTSQSLLHKQFGAANLVLGRERVTVENAPVTFLQSNHAIMQRPNQLTDADFEGWVQERGLYFAANWDAAWTPLLRMNDPGEKPLDGSLLVSQYGQGTIVYTGLSFFRQLPAGVPGAYRLFMNLVEASWHTNQPKK